MLLVIDAKLKDYFDDLHDHGIAFHYSMDFIDFMSPALVNMGLVEERVELWCPSFQLCLWRAFHTKEIVGVHFEQPVARALAWNRAVPDNALTLMDWADEGLEAWSLGAHSPRLPVSEESVVKALVMHQQARDFFRTYPEMVPVPPRVEVKMIVQWRRKGSPSSGTH